MTHQFANSDLKTQLQDMECDDRKSQTAYPFPFENHWVNDMGGDIMVNNRRISDFFSPPFILPIRGISYSRDAAKYLWIIQL